MNRNANKLVPIPFISSRDEGFREWIKQNCGRKLHDKESVLSYLRKGHCLSAVPGIERDPFDHDSLIDDPPHVLSDGRWVWVLTLAHWVESKDVLLPEEFVDEMRMRKFEISFPVEISKDKCKWLRDPDFFKPPR
jgi:hypothetical protein